MYSVILSTGRRAHYCFMFPVGSKGSRKTVLLGRQMCSAWIDALRLTLPCVGVSFSPGDSSAFVTSPTSVFPPSATFPAAATQNAFPHESATNQEANGEIRCLFVLLLHVVCRAGESS